MATTLSEAYQEAVRKRQRAAAAAGANPGTEDITLAAVSNAAAADAKATGWAGAMGLKEKALATDTSLGKERLEQKKSLADTALESQERTSSARLVERARQADISAGMEEGALEEAGRQDTIGTALGVGNLALTGGALYAKTKDVEKQTKQYEDMIVSIKELPALKKQYTDDLIEMLFNIEKINKNALVSGKK